MADEAIFDKSRKTDSSGALADTNEIREIAPDNFYNEENNKAEEVKNEEKHVFEKSSKLKKAKQRAMDANNKQVAKKQKNKLNKQNIKPPSPSR